MNQLLGQQQLGGGQQQQNAQPNTIQVNVSVSMQGSYVQLQLQIDPDIPFNDFAKGLTEPIFAQRMQAQYEETIEYMIGGANILFNDNRTLNQLGFTNNCTLYIRLKLKPRPHIQIECQYQQDKRIFFFAYLSFQPFASFLDLILLKHQNDIQIPQEFINQIECELEQGVSIKQNETRSLEDLGLNCGSTLYIKLMNRKDQNQLLLQKRIVKVSVDLQFQKIQLNTLQYQSSPISCVFHDILMELIVKLQFHVLQPLRFFINEVAIDPFDCKQLRYFQIFESINLKMITFNQQSKEKEKYQFVLKNKNKWQKFNLEKTIKIEYANICSEDRNLEMLVLINTSLQDITKQIINLIDVRLIYRYLIKYQINGVQLQEVNSIYSKTDMKVLISIKDDFKFEFIGDFYQKIIIWGYIDNQTFLIEESIEINGSLDELLVYVKFKIFGPKQQEYSQEILEKESGFIKVNYIQKNK